MTARTLVALLLAATLAGAVDAPALEAPLHNPAAKRLREKAQAKWEAARVVFARQKARRKDQTPPTADELRQAVALAVESIELFEAAQIHEWDTLTNQLEAQVARAWAEMRVLLPPEKPPEDPAELAKWNKNRERAAAKRKRSARRWLGKVLGGRRYTKLFTRCPRCDGRGEVMSGSGGQRGQKPQKRVCPMCGGEKVIANRKRILAAYWFCYSPNYRADGRHISDLGNVLRRGAREKRRLAPFFLSARIGAQAEDHGWWVRLSVIEKVHEDPNSRKGVERTTDYVLMNIGKIWWIHVNRFDEKHLLKLPVEPEPEPER